MTPFHRYIGLPFHATDFNCWHLVQRVQREQFGRDLPYFDLSARDHRAVIHAFGTATERHHWHRVALPCHGCGVLMCRAKHASHAGVWLDIDGGGILHNLEGIGVVFQKPANLLGIRIEGYYVHR